MILNRPRAPGSTSAQNSTSGLWTWQRIRPSVSINRDKSPAYHLPIDPMFAVYVWSGIRQGWVRTSSAKDRQGAHRFADLLRKVRGDLFTYKVERI